MPPVKPQRLAYLFLTEHLQSQEVFSLKDFQEATTWSNKSFRTYLSKQFRGFLHEVKEDSYRVTETFRPYVIWRKFREHVTQVRRVVTKYAPLKFDKVLIYEFFMPLAHENVLRTTLDSLFYKDTIIARLKTLDSSKLKEHFPREDNEAETDYFLRLCSWIEGKFQGYSISHVDGRFRAERLSTWDEVAKIRKQGRRYLIDETTAITRFIFPCDDKDEAGKVEFLFHQLFVESIIQLINGEDEIWMIESGMKNHIHIWKGDDPEEGGDMPE